jgi:hypothetical protein
MHTDEQQRASVARVYDYLLGGRHHSPADREVAQTILASIPTARVGVLANRAFLRRAVRYLAESGVRQFLDIGSGLPTEGNVHEIAQSVIPDARVVYVDIDPDAVTESLTILDGNPHATAVVGNLLHPDAILDNPQVRGVLDFDQPIALLIVAVAHFIDDDADPFTAVARLRSALPAGSYLVFSHLSNEGQDFKDGDVQVDATYRQRVGSAVKMRNRQEITRFFEGLDLVEPGLVWAAEWHPDPADTLTFDDPRHSMSLVGIGRVPRSS